MGATGVPRENPCRHGESVPTPRSSMAGTCFCFFSSFLSHQCSIMKQHWMERCYSRTCESRVQAWLDMTDSMDVRLSLSPASMYFSLLLFSYVHIRQDVHFWFEVVILVLSSQQKNFSSSVSVLEKGLIIWAWIMFSAEPVCFARRDWLASLTHMFTTGHKESERVLEGSKR